MGGQRTGIRNPGDGPGQPTKLTRHVLETVVRGLECGLSVRAACRNADISQASHENYLKRGEKDAAAGANSIYADYLRCVLVGEIKGTYARRSAAWEVIRMDKPSPEQVARAKLAMQFDAMIEGGRLSRTRRVALRKGLAEGAGGAGQPQQPPAEEAKSVPVELSRLNAPEFTRYQSLTAKARVAFTSLTPAEVQELQSLLRKAQGLELTSPAAGAETGGAVPDGSTTPPESSRAPSGDAPPVAP